MPHRILPSSDTGAAWGLVLVPLLLLLAMIPAGATAQLADLDQERRAFRVLDAERAGPYPPSEVIFEDGRAQVLDGRLALRLLELIESSPTFAGHWGEISTSDIPTYIGTYESFGVSSRALSSGRTHFIPDREREGYVLAAYVIVNATFIEEQYVRLLELEDAPGAEDLRTLIHWELLSTLGHEVAHVYDVARDAGAFDHFCADPLPGEPVVDACAVQRENIYRGELGIPLTRYYGMIPPEEALDTLRARQASDG